jgi:hypothetical protein
VNPTSSRTAAQQSVVAKQIVDFILAPYSFARITITVLNAQIGLPLTSLV